MRPQHSLFFYTHTHTHRERERTNTTYNIRKKKVIFAQLTGEQLHVRVILRVHRV